MIKNCCMLVAGLLLHTQIFAQDKTAASRTGEDYTLSNGAVEAVFSGSGSFDIEKLVLNGKQVVGAGKNETPWILIYKGSQGENPELKPEHAVYRGVQVRDDARAKTLVFTWELTLDYSPVKYPVRMYVTLPDGGELLQWNIEADLPAGWLVTDLKFPNVVIERPEDGRIITTEGWGVEKPLDIATFEARYPSHASAMQFLVVHNAEGAFYYGTEDRRGCGKTYSAQCTPTTVALSDAIPASAGWIAERPVRDPFPLRPDGSRTGRSACRGSRSRVSRRRVGKMPLSGGTVRLPSRPNGAVSRSPRAISRSGVTMPTRGCVPSM